MATSFARKLRRKQTDAEKVLWYSLRNRQVNNCKFRRQHQIGSYIVDFCCVERNLVVELDGGQHLIREKKDNLRTHFLNKIGFRVLRFWDHEVLKQKEIVLEAIRMSLGNPHPSPLPKRERE